MGFVVYCDNKGCGKMQEPLLDLTDNEVYCSECSGKISTMTPFAKTQMKSSGQIKRAKRTQQAFSLQCDCGHAAQPKLLKDKLVCIKCEKEFDGLGAPRTHAIKEWLRSNSRPV
jgi:hypothetical protein